MRVVVLVVCGVVVVVVVVVAVAVTMLVPHRCYMCRRVTVGHPVSSFVQFLFLRGMAVTVTVTMAAMTVT